jgi:hypothetical protein
VISAASTGNQYCQTQTGSGKAESKAGIWRKVRKHVWFWWPAHAVFSDADGKTAFRILGFQA